MFVAASMMPHHIRITGVCVERLQDISDEDCLREGVYRDVDGGRVIGYPFGVPFYYTFTGAISKDGKNLHWATELQKQRDNARGARYDELTTQINILRCKIVQTKYPVYQCDTENPIFY